ncbi:MYXO-CTERM sorting domain-containing protein [Polyangium sorediatum]
MATSTTTGAGGGNGEIPSSEDGCGACVVGGGSAKGAPWVGLGLLLALRRRRQSPRGGAPS